MTRTVILTVVNGVEETAKVAGALEQAGYLKDAQPDVDLLVYSAPEPATPTPLQPFKFLHWPTDYKVITQAFNVNAANYAPFGLPGHEGLDIRAPEGTPIYAVADGIVFETESQIALGVKHNYGWHVRLKTEASDGEFHTVYAHASALLAHPGAKVLAGQQIAKAGNTGNSFGAHLHLTLKKIGATAAGQTSFPLDIIDPTPYTTPLLPVLTPDQYQVLKAAANVRDAPDGTNGKIIYTLSTGEIFTDLGGRSGDWWRIKLADGREGWIWFSPASGFRKGS